MSYPIFKSTLKTKTPFYFFIFAIILFGCKPKDPDDPKKEETPSENVDLTFKFVGLYNNSPVDWSMFYITAAGDTAKFAKIKYILSNFTLEKTNGDLVKIPDAYGYVNLAGTPDNFVVKNVPKGEYRSLRVQVGLDSPVNHGNPLQWGIDHPLNPSLTNMHWGWTGGYIFNIVEGYYKNNGGQNSFAFHVALDKNVRNHSINYNYNITKNSIFTMNVNMDKFFSNTINFSLKTDGDFSHSGNTDSVMAKFLQNANGIITIKDFQ